METYTIRDLSFTYPLGQTKALDRVSLRVAAGAFTVICGPSGCGKSTLLRQLKTALAPHGERTGEILFEGLPLDSLGQRGQSSRIGFVLQSPDNQLVTDKVWHELAFGLESLGADTPSIRRRVAEMASFFGIESWFYKPVSELSGGQKQLLNLAAIMTMQPSCLLLDEPTSQLDPIAASDFLSTLGRINRELGTTILLTEHRLEEVFPLATDVVVLGGGRVVCEGTPAGVGETLRARGSAMFAAMPAPMRIYAAVPNELPCPVTVREGRAWLGRYAEGHPLGEIPPVEEKSDPNAEITLKVEDAWFKYEKDTPDVVKGLSLIVRRGELLAILGGNGAGKSTTLGLLAGLRRPYRGAVTVLGGSPEQAGSRLGLLPQNPQTLFVKKTVEEDLRFALGRRPEDELRRRVAAVAGLCRLGGLLSRHPYDLSGGEQQRAALAKVLLREPEVLLLDEPTKGLDAEFKRCFAGILNRLTAHGVTVVMVSHDIEFCAAHAARCALFFDGSVVTEAAPRAFFSGNSFYTTSANRMARSLLPEAVTAEDVIAACGGTPPAPPAEPEEGEAYFERPAPAPQKAPPRAALPLWRRLAALAAAGGTAYFFVRVLRATDLSALFTAGELNAAAGLNLKLYLGLLVCLAALVLLVSRKSPSGGASLQTAPEDRRLPRRTVAALFIILLLIPLTIFVGVAWLGNRKYYFISLLVLLECMAPFALIFESRRPRARELVLIAALCALCAAARAAFFMLPGFSPVFALVILAGVAFGGETGFLVGAMTMLVSNILFQQGPWTPWQMFAMGLLGFLAGVLYRKGLLRRGRASLAIFGALATIVVYGGIMNPCAAIVYQSAVTWKVLLAYYVTGFPVDLVHAAAAAFFLWTVSQPMLEKLDRVKTKYGLAEPSDSRP